MGNYTVYLNPYLVLRSGGYTKHFYIEGQRITSKLGSGSALSKGNKAGGDQVDYPGRQEAAREGIVRNLKFLGQDGALLTAGKSGKTPPGQVIGSGNGNGGNGGGGKDQENFMYFFHPDHLGSSSYITDASGEVYQHLEYFAFGETFVEEHSNTDKMPYLYNGKELDEETGLYYYGARYYDAKTSVWLSVDPLAEERSWLSPYNYVQNNPIMRVDPDGALDEWVRNLETGEYEWKPEVTSQKDTPEGYKYIGSSIQDVYTDFNKEQPGYDFWSEANINYSNWPGEINTDKNNFAGDVKEGISKLPFPANIVGNALYSTADNAYISFLQTGKNRKNFEGHGMGGSEITDAGINTLTSIIPYTKVARVNGVNASQFSSMLKGTRFNKALYQGGHRVRGWANKAYNYIYTRQVDYSIKAVSGGTTAAGSNKKK